MDKTYTKPTIEQVSLMPSEAVLGACKSDIFPGPGPLNWQNLCRCGEWDNCYGFGS